MAKRRKRRAERRQQNKEPLTQQVSNEDLAVGRRLTKYHSLIIGLAIAPTFYNLIYVDWLTATGGDFVRWWMAGLTVVGFIGAYLTSFPIPTRFYGDPKGFRRRSVYLLALAIFIFQMEFVPLLYVKGYFNVVTNIFPSKGELSKYASLAAAFLLGAIISGILGNASYDLLKYIVKRLSTERKP